MLTLPGGVLDTLYRLATGLILQAPRNWARAKRMVERRYAPPT